MASLTDRLVAMEERVIRSLDAPAKRYVRCSIVALFSSELSPVRTTHKREQDNI